jgi:hypothetical protein
MNSEIIRNDVKESGLSSPYLSGETEINQETPQSG